MTKNYNYHKYQAKSNELGNQPVLSSVRLYDVCDNIFYWRINNV